MTMTCLMHDCRGSLPQSMLPDNNMWVKHKNTDNVSCLHTMRANK